MTAHVRLLYGVFFLSGIAGLGYQMVWSRMFAVGLGHELLSVLAVVSAFFGGLALGGWLLDSRVSRSSYPGRWYVALELVIGIWGFVTIGLVPLENNLALRLIGIGASPLWHWTVAFGLPFLTLLPATTAMGATLPAMERFVAPLTKHGRCVGGLYAANTLGAVMGTLLGTFVILPALGFRATLIFLASLNLLSAAAAALLARDRRSQEDEPAALHAEVSWRRIGLTMFFTGLLGIGYEALAVRVTAQILENTVYSFAAALSVYLMGTAVGAALYQRIGRSAAFQPLLGYLLVAISTSCMLGTFALSHVLEIYRFGNNLFGDGLRGVIAAEMVVALAVFTLPTLCMGATFSHLVQAARRKLGGVGRAAAVNTLGAALAPSLFGVLLLPSIGAKWSLVIVSLGYLILLGRTSRLAWLGAVLPVLALFVLPPHLRMVSVRPGEKVIEYREGVMASVAVLRRKDGHRNLRVNNRYQMGGTASKEAEYRQTWIPLLLHPEPKRALFLGVGTGVSFGAAAVFPGLSADGVELVPEVVDVLHYFEPENMAPQSQPQLELFVADARRFVGSTDASYDVIVGDLFQPARDGSGALYTREHFQTVRARLASGGMFCQWLPLHQLDEPMLRVIIATFLDVFPHTRAFLVDFTITLPAVALVGSLEPVSYSAAWYGDRLRAAPELATHLRSANVYDAFNLLGTLLASAEQLRDYAGDAQLNTDDHPVVIFGAPRFLYKRGVPMYGRLMKLLEHAPADVAELLDGDPSGPLFAERLAAFIRARDLCLKARVIEVEQGVAESAQTLFESVRASQDFWWSYRHGLYLATKAASADPGLARSLCEGLIEAEPRRPDAQRLLDRLNRP